MNQERMVLWNKDSLNEFAIKYNSIFQVTTSNDPEAMIKIDECLYRFGYELDWHYTLSQWVVYYLANSLLESKISIQIIKSSHSMTRHEIVIGNMVNIINRCISLFYKGKLLLKLFILILNPP